MLIVGGLILSAEESAATMPEGRFGAGFTAVNETLYLIGGIRGSGSAYEWHKLADRIGVAAFTAEATKRYLPPIPRKTRRCYEKPYVCPRERWCEREIEVPRYIHHSRVGRKWQ